ncbi:MAG: cytochrome P450, partial [Solirubrobacteraceae bacterium]|nr:cytochrome P450 [Solirubrobacteraceae bacterium]
GGAAGPLARGHERVMTIGRHRRGHGGAPSLDLDLYADDVLKDSRAAFSRVREAGPAVWLPRHGLYAVGRFDDVRAALRDDAVFLSGDGVAANPVANRLGRHTTLSSDGDTHTVRRRVLMRSLGAKAIAAIEPALQDEATDVVRDLTGTTQFEAGRDFSARLPVRVVSELVGIRGGSERLLRWAAATFDGLGPVNRRSIRSTPRAMGLWMYTQRLKPGAVARGSWAASVFDAQRAGGLSEAEARALIIDFVAPSLDTTILATNHLLAMLAANPDAWAAIREDPNLVNAAVVENVRLASPIRGFTRRLARDHEIDGVPLPKGARVALLYGAANLDETRFPEPGRFDLGRPSGAHLGWGNGPHTCVGIHLAKLEMRTLLQAMLPEVERIVAGPARRLRNNTLQGITHMPARLLRV